ncbi:adenylate/guanylate cyclase domain-containing protein [Thalassospira lucentensis]|uniref:adenylate/guanylate cyclase domain-containing protein n=1 Tax=Thalassospira lucentensis TaxID=168935 RepID=UPI00142E5DC9|nr:adenylate/guanylate cyclase domain-containing protein [Thalassospira lucentensis]NIZ02620.1 adenylate/guanylate cyclase domain-containing protein [Thalassospira lucentensis]
MNQTVARNQVSYEVYVKDRSGRWEIHAHFTGAQKSQAEEEAKQIERSAHVSAVKVIREIYSHATNSSDEYVIYETRDKGGKTAPGAQAQAPRGKAPAKPAPFVKPAANCAPKPQAPAHFRTTTVKNARSEPDEFGIIGLSLKIAITFCAAVALGLAAMLLGAKGLEYLGKSGVHISRDIVDKANFMFFIIGFLASAVPMLMVVTKKYKAAPRNPSAKPEPVSRTSAQIAAGPKDSETFESANSANAAPASHSTTPAAEVTAESSTDTTPPAAFDVGNMGANDVEPDNVLSEQTDSDDEASAITADIPDTQPIDTPRMRTTRAKMKDFITGSVNAIKRNVQNLDAYNKFGLNLYVAGACDACSEKNELEQKDGRTVLRDCITALGADKSMADTFCKNVDSYILEPKYKDMYGAGRQSMDSYFEDENSITESVSNALKSWGDKTSSKPQTPNGPKLHALMFTDIVNSTQRTQELGDHGAQQMLHVHNQIVRTALINNYGKEVKHMGDGIMAVFPSSASAVEASIEIQKNMAGHNANNDLKFQIRIGINSGEAIAEENDLFGTVVQLAARVCSQAGGDEILVSENTKNTYAGSRASFTSRGPRTMKGFAEPVEVFAVTARA